MGAVSAERAPGERRAPLARSSPAPFRPIEVHVRDPQDGRQGPLCGRSKPQRNSDETRRVHRVAGGAGPCDRAGPCRVRLQGHHSPGPGHQRRPRPSREIGAHARQDGDPDVHRDQRLVAAVGESGDGRAGWRCLAHEPVDQCADGSRRVRRATSSTRPAPAPSFTLGVAPLGRERLHRSLSRRPRRPERRSGADDLLDQRGAPCRTPGARLDARRRWPSP